MLVITGVVGALLGGTIACGDEDSGDGGGPVVCYDTVDSCADCPAGLTCGTLAAGGVECYTPCDTASDCGACETETTCGYGEGNRMLCVMMQ